jgi:drug/metabolite transporter (DMT)-like permease
VKLTAGTTMLLASGMAMFGSATPVSKIVTGAFPVFVASAARMLLAVVFLGSVLLITGRLGGLFSGISRSDWIRLGVIALTGMFGFTVLMLYGMKEIPGAIGGIVMATTPAVTAAGAVIFLGDRIDRWTAIAIGSAVSGIVFINVAGTGSDGGGSTLLGVALVFGAVCGEASYTLIGKRLTADLSPLAISAIAAAAALVLFAVPAAVQVGEVEWGSVPFTDWLALVWFGIGTMGIGSLLWYSGVSRVSGATASAFMGVMPLSALLLSYLLLGESFEPVHLVGLVAVLIAIAAVLKSEREAECRAG